MFKIILLLVPLNGREGEAMPYMPEHKQQTRERIVEAAGRLFNRRGFAEVTIGEIMSAAGRTHGVSTGTSAARKSSMPKPCGIF
jgi:hypothetical protein